MTETITREKLYEVMIESDFTLIEVLPEKYYNEGHIPGAASKDNYSKHCRFP